MAPHGRGVGSNVGVERTGTAPIGSARNRVCVSTMVEGGFRLAAVEDALALMGQGVGDVRLESPIGRTYYPSELHLLLDACGSLDA